MSDTYKRREVSPGVYQCGCKWDGSVLIQCLIHHQATVASVDKFDRERAAALARKDGAPE